MIWTLIIVEQRNEFHFYLIFLLLDQRKLINLLFWLMIVSGTSHCIIRERNLLRSQANVGKSLQYNNDFTYCFRLEPTWSMIEPICSSHLSFNDKETVCCSLQYYQAHRPLITTLIFPAMKSSGNLLIIIGKFHYF